MYTFLLRTSILSQLTAPLCDAVLEQAGSQRVLEELERTNVFVVPLDRQRRWYRYHAFFAEALRTRLEQVGGVDMRALHLRASRWYEQEGNIAHDQPLRLSRLFVQCHDLQADKPLLLSEIYPGAVVYLPVIDCSGSLPQEQHSIHQRQPVAQ